MEIYSSFTKIKKKNFRLYIHDIINLVLFKFWSFLIFWGEGESIHNLKWTNYVNNWSGGKENVIIKEMLF